MGKFCIFVSRMRKVIMDNLNENAHVGKFKPSGHCAFVDTGVHAFTFTQLGQSLVVHYNCAHLRNLKKNKIGLARRTKQLVASKKGQTGRA